MVEQELRHLLDRLLDLVESTGKQLDADAAIVREYEANNMALRSIIALQGVTGRDMIRSVERTRKHLTEGV